MPTMMNCCSACSRGHKGIVAKKTWHGRFPFDVECGTIGPTPPQTKYLGKRVTLMLTSEASSSDDFWTSSDPSVATAVHCESSGEFSHERSARTLVDRYSGVIALTDCTEDKDGPTYTGSCSDSGYTSPTAASTAFDDIICGSPSFAVVEYADIFSMMDSACGAITTGAQECAANLTYFGTPRTPAEIEAYYEGPDFNYETLETIPNLCETTGITNYSTVTRSGSATCKAELSATKIEIHIEFAASVITHSWMVIVGVDAGSDFGHRDKIECALPTASSYNVRSTVDLVIILDRPYTAKQCNDDVDALLGLRLLTDMADYTWHYGCTYPLVRRDEVGVATSPNDYEHGNCSWVDVNATTGGIGGTGYTGDVINGSGAISEWTSAVTGTTPDGAYKDFGLIYPTIQVLVACKYAEVISVRPSHNWYRPCGPDRTLTDFISGQRYPDAWPICGHLTVSAVSNTTPIEVTTDEHALQTGDLVDISAGSASGTNLTITVTSSSTFTIDGSTANGTTVGGALVTNAASTSPPSEVWNDDTPDGDYLVLFYQFDERAGPYAIQESLPPPRVNNGLYGFGTDVTDLSVSQGNIPPGGTAVVCISPSGENFGAYGITHPFPGVADPLILDYLFGARWVGQVRQRMRNPINMVSLTDYVEARNSEPVGAPDLPSFANGGIEADGCDWQNSEPYVCPYVNILTIAEITAYAEAVVGSVYPVTEGVVAPPLFACAAFDNDVP